MTEEPAQSGVADVTAILLTIGRDRAARLLAHFEVEDVTLLSRQTDKLANLSQEYLNTVAHSFEAEFTKGAGLLNPSRSFTDFLHETRADVLQPDSDDAPDSVDEAPDPWDVISTHPDKLLGDYLDNENAIIKAFILSKLPPPKAAAILKEFEAEIRADVVSLMLNVKATPRMEEVLSKRLAGELANKTADEDGNNSRQTVASIINCFDQKAGDALTESLKETVSEETFAALSQNIFRFEDIILLDPTACAKLCESVEQVTLTKALHDADPALVEALLSTFSQRARRMITSELEVGAATSGNDIEEARRSLAQSVRDLANDGQLNMPERE